MKMIKTLVCATAACVAFALCASTSKAIVLPPTIVTNYSVITLSLTIKTNTTVVNGLKVTKQVKSTKFVTKDLLNLLASPDFANTAFPSNAQIVIGWDQPTESHVLVVDKTGTNILYDVTAHNNANTNFEITPISELGAVNENFNGNNPGGESFTGFNSGSFDIYVSNSIDLWGPGPSTENFSINWDKNGVNQSWSDSMIFTPQNGDQRFGASTGGTMTGTITIKGHGKGTPYNLYPRID